MDMSELSLGRRGSDAASERPGDAGVGHRRQESATFPVRVGQQCRIATRTENGSPW